MGLDSRYLVIIVHMPISRKGALYIEIGCGNFTLIGCKMSGFPSRESIAIDLDHAIRKGQWSRNNESLCMLAFCCQDQ